ncbi:hypothetical protein [Cytobacillus oceanisediminis]|uniref:hypothetical protein n=1 Tax=Cytobacillus oceanisediminis TaxID=665099 RepID=UPI003736CBA8
MAAVVKNHHSLILLIEYLTNVKKVLKMEDETEKLDFYLQDKFKNKMNEYLEEYNQAVQVVKTSNELNIFQIRFFDTFFYVAAYTKEQAKKFFEAEFGEVHEIRIELPELEVESEEGLHTLRQLTMKKKSFPAILGSWELYKLEKPKL